jgi:hypothetical protein
MAQSSSHLGVSLVLLDSLFSRPVLLLGVAAHGLGVWTLLQALQSVESDIRLATACLESAQLVFVVFALAAVVAMVQLVTLVWRPSTNVKLILLGAHRTCHALTCDPCVTWHWVFLT